MRITTLAAGAGLFAVCFLLPGDADAGRFGGGYRGGGFGGYRGGYGGGWNRGGYGGGGDRGGYGGWDRGAPLSRPAQSFHPQTAQRGTVHGPYGGSRNTVRQTGTISGSRGGAGTAQRGVSQYTGPHGGQAVGGARGGSYTTQGGYTVNRGEAGGVYTGPRGGVHVGGGQATTVTGPGGSTVGGASRGGVTIGPNGNVHAGGASAAGVKTPTGGAVVGGRGGVTAGPGGVAVSGARGGVATGPGGTVAAGSRGAAAVGPYGAVAAGSRGVAGVGPYGAGYAGTRYVGAATLANQGYAVRSGFGYYNRFTPGWYARYPGAWYSAGLVAGAWTAASWANSASYIGYPVETAPVDYDYGNTVTYQDGNVYYGDQVAATEAQYAEQAQQIADAGTKTEPAPDEKWQPLGVFAMVVGDETTSNDIFQLALNKEGVVRGNYYNAKTDTATPAAGSLDKKTQRVAWTVGDKKDVVYEAGLFNLTKDETTLLVHFGKDRTEQYRLFRIEQPKDGEGAAPMK